MRHALVVVLAVAGCSELATPAELARPQVLGLGLEPAVLTPGSRGRLTALVAGPDGPIESSPVWSVDAGRATIERDQGEQWLRIAEQAEPQVLELHADFDIDGTTLLATRTATIGAAVVANPVIDAILADGADVDPAAGLQTELGATIELAVDARVEPESATESVAWYSTIGEIDIYHRAETELVASEGGSGWLIVVCRDGAGGIAWEIAPLIVSEAP